ncbi:hypothetical protein FACS189496_5460 [Bacilli bacterium]|nr:hypothetical protein FACS189496_5460 [Bacilli bacterium]
MAALGGFQIVFLACVIILFVAFVLYKTSNNGKITYTNKYFSTGTKKIGIIFDILIYANTIATFIFTLAGFIIKSDDKNNHFIFIFLVTLY